MLTYISYIHIYKEVEGMRAHQLAYQVERSRRTLCRPAHTRTTPSPTLRDDETATATPKGAVTSDDVEEGYKGGSAAL